MKTLTIFIFIIIHVSLFTFHSVAQPCLPEGITFTTQAQIDSFQINYPGCTEIEGDVIIGHWEADNITNLFGLSSITLIGGDLNIEYTDSLINLIGLENIDSIGGNLNIKYNEALQNLCGLEGLDHIGSLRVGANPLMRSIASLANISEVEGDLQIGFRNGPIPSGNDSLKTLAGLENITYVGGTLAIDNNPALESLSVLSNLNYTGGLEIIFNNALTGLTGLEGISSLEGSLSIGTTGYLNAKYGNNSLTNLSGLDNLNVIDGDLHIAGNSSLLNLEGLENLDIIGGSLSVYGAGLNSYDTLLSLTGLEGLASIGGNLTVSETDYLTDLTALGNLTYVGGKISFEHNHSMTSLSGLDNIDADSVTGLTLYKNALSDCAVPSVCNIINYGVASISIGPNSSGCNTVEEVADACGITGVDSMEGTTDTPSVIVYPNPANNTVSVVSQTGIELLSVKIIDIQGRVLMHQNVINDNLSYNVSSFPKGLYFIRATTSKGIEVKKLVIR